MPPPPLDGLAILQAGYLHPSEHSLQAEPQAIIPSQLVRYRYSGGTPPAEKLSGYPNVVFNPVQIRLGTVVS